MPSGQSIEDIFATNVSKNSKTFKEKIEQKKKPTSIEKAILRYGASRIIDLSAHMRAWFSSIDRQSMAKNHEALLKIPELPDEVNTFISEVEKVSTLTGFFICCLLFILHNLFLQMVYQGNSDAAFKLCTEKYHSSPINSCIKKISKIYSEL